MTHVIWEKSAKDAFLKELEETLRARQGRALGHRLRHRLQHRLPRRAGAGHAGARRRRRSTSLAVSQSLRQTNMQFVIERADYKKAVVALNKALCVDLAGAVA